MADKPIAYVADSLETALYESVFRREVRRCHWDGLTESGLEERYPVLQSLRYKTSQALPKTAERRAYTAFSMPDLAPAPRLRVFVQIRH